MASISFGFIVAHSRRLVPVLITVRDRLTNVQTPNIGLIVGIITLVVFCWLIVLNVINVPTQPLPSGDVAPQYSAPVSIVHNDVQGPVFASVSVSQPVLPTTFVAAPITNIEIPKLQLNSSVVEVSWIETYDADGRKNLEWEVARYAVGHHATSASPGESSNIVLSGHVGGYGKVFRNLDQLIPNDHILLTSGDKAYTYVVAETFIVEENNASAIQQKENVRFIAPTTNETLTLITCWPPSGPDKYTQRLIVRALPLKQGALQ
jgi:LPXTG-site transpeptidase (sortase) family protein